MIRVLSFLLVLSANSFAFENPYADKNIDKNISNFVSSEIVISFNEAVNSYNKKRGELPEITRKDQFYTISKDNSIVEFNIPMFLSKTFLLNGTPVRYKDIKELDKHTKKVSLLESISLISSAYADQFSDGSSSNRILFASIIEFEGNLQDAGLMNDNAKINFSKIASRIDTYNDACNNNQNSPENSEEVGSLLKSMAKVSFEMVSDRKKLDKMLDGKLHTDLKEGSCEKQLEPLLKTGLLNLRAYAHQNRDGVDQVTIPTLCSKIQSLKQCLSNAYNNNNEIINTVWRDNPKLYLPGGQDNYRAFENATGIAK